VRVLTDPLWSVKWKAKQSAVKPDAYFEVKASSRTRHRIYSRLEPIYPAGSRESMRGPPVWY